MIFSCQRIEQDSSPDRTKKTAQAGTSAAQFRQIVAIPLLELRCAGSGLPLEPV
jgi:hypothetical protein